MRLCNCNAHWSVLLAICLALLLEAAVQTGLPETSDAFQSGHDYSYQYRGVASLHQDLTAIVQAEVSPSLLSACSYTIKSRYYCNRNSIDL